MKDIAASVIIGIGIGVFMTGMIQAREAEVRPCIEAAAKGIQLVQCKEKP